MKRLRKLGFRCDQAVDGSVTSTIVCSTGTRIQYRALVVLTPSKSVNMVITTARLRWGSPSKMQGVLGALAGITLENPKLLDQARQFVENSVARNRSANGMFGMTRVRVYPDGNI